MPNPLSDAESRSPEPQFAKTPNPASGRARPDRCKRGSGIVPFTEVQTIEVTAGIRRVNASDLSEAKAQSCTVRRLLPTDAPAVTRLVESVYGDSYYPPAFYDPQEIVQMNERGTMLSILAVNSESEVVGHYGLERQSIGAVAEASDAIVAAEYRHHHLMENMRVLLREEALGIGLTGLVGYPVTNHLFSQMAEEHFGAHPSGIAPSRHGSELTRSGQPRLL